MVPNQYKCSVCSFIIRDGNIHEDESCPSCGDPVSLKAEYSDASDTEVTQPIEPIVPDTHAHIWQENEQEDEDGSI